MRPIREHILENIKDGPCCPQIIDIGAVGRGKG